MKKYKMGSTFEAKEHSYPSTAKKIIGVDINGNITDANYIKFDPDDSTPVYIGTNDDADASVDDTDWLIYKFIYSAGNVTDIRKKKGAWSGRVALFT